MPLTNLACSDTQVSRSFTAQGDAADGPKLPDDAGVRLVTAARDETEGIVSSLLQGFRFVAAQGMLLEDLIRHHADFRPVPATRDETEGIVSSLLQRFQFVAAQGNVAGETELRHHAHFRPVPSYKDASEYPRLQWYACIRSIAVVEMVP